MTVAFVVLTHSQPESLAELLRELSPYPTYLHIDRPAFNSEFVQKSEMASHPLIDVNPNPRCLHWGGFSIVQSMMETLELALKLAPVHVQHFAFLSGQCFPLRPVEEFVHHLMNVDTPVQCRAVRLSDAEGVPQGLSTKRLDRRHWLDGFVGHTKKAVPFFGSGMRRAMTSVTWPMKLDPPKINHGLGSQWVSVPRQLGEELVEAYKLGVFNYLRNSYAPDEMAIPSFVYSTRWMELTQYGGFEKASNSGTKVSSYPNYHWLRPNMDGNVNIQDISMGLKSGQFFIRKMSRKDYPEAYEYIRENW